MFFFSTKKSGMSLRECVEVPQICGAAPFGSSRAHLFRPVAGAAQQIIPGALDKSDSFVSFN